MRDRHRVVVIGLFRYTKVNASGGAREKMLGGGASAVKVPIVEGVEEF